jgi:hypothetical protein
MTKYNFVGERGGPVNQGPSMEGTASPLPSIAPLATPSPVGGGTTDSQSYPTLTSDDPISR